MPSLKEALAKAGLVKEEEVKQLDAKDRKKLLEGESFDRQLFGGGRVLTDEERSQRERSDTIRASREANRAGGNTASKAYLDRFKSQDRTADPVWKVSQELKK